MMRSTFFLTAVAFAAGVVGNLSADDHGKLLNELLSTNTLVRFIAIVEENRLPAPVIPSKWFAERVATVERVRVLNARTFGSSMLQRLDACASRLVVVSNLEQCAQQTDVLLRIASWLGGAESYGSALLATRAQDVATMPAGRLLVATNFPTEKVTLLISRFVGSWYGADVRARILDAEAGTNLFVSSTARLITQRTLQEVWTLGQWRRALLRGELSRDFQLAGINQDQCQIQQPESAGNRTTRERWLFNNHEAFVIGLEPANVRMLRSLARFRELVGEFPTSVPYSNHPFTSQQEAAFEYAWRSHRGKEGAVYSLAFHAYQKITRGEFVDQDTAIVRMRSFDGDVVSGY